MIANYAIGKKLWNKNFVAETARCKLVTFSIVMILFYDCKFSLFEYLVQQRLGGGFGAFRIANRREDSGDSYQQSFQSLWFRLQPSSLTEHSSSSCETLYSHHRWWDIRLFCEFQNPSSQSRVESVQILLEQKL